MTASRSRRSMAPGIELVQTTTLVEQPVDTWLGLGPGDRVLVSIGESVAPGTAIAERLRDARLAETASNGSTRPGDPWTLKPGAPGPRPGAALGEYLYESGGRWRIAAGDRPEPLDSPVAGIVRDVRPGIGVAIRATGAGLRGAFALGGSARGRLAIAADADAEILPRALDVGAAGTILVVGARIEAEALTRARAMGVRGIVVASLATKEQRDFLASEARQRAALHRLPPLAVLVLHGTLRRSISLPVMRFLEALVGRDVAIVGEPPRLVFDPEGIELDVAQAEMVQVRTGPLAGQEGHWNGLAGLRRFAGGTHLEAGWVRFGDDPPSAGPLGDLERIA